MATAPDGSRCAFNDPTDADYVGMAWFSGLDSPGHPGGHRPPRRRGRGGPGAQPPGRAVGRRDVQIVRRDHRPEHKQTKLKRALNALRADGTLPVPARRRHRQPGEFRLRGASAARTSAAGCTPPVPADLRRPGHRRARPSGRPPSSSAPWQATVTNQGDGLALPTINVTISTQQNVVFTNVRTGEGLTLNQRGPVYRPTPSS